VLLNIDVAFKVVRTDTVLSYMNELMSKARGDPNEAVQTALSGTTVVTKYNQKTYKIDRVDFA